LSLIVTSVKFHYLLTGWYQSIGPCQYEPASGWGIPELVELNAGDAHSPRIAIDADGNAIAVWLQSDGQRDNLWDNLWGNYYAAGIGWGTAALIESDDVGNAADAEVVMAPDGAAVVLWSQADGRLNGSGEAQANTLWSNRFVSATGWGLPARIDSNISIHAFATQLAVDGVGNLMALWSDTSDGVTYNISTNRYVVGAGWQTAQLLRAGALGDAVSPLVKARLAMNANGAAAVVWAETASPTSVWAATYTPVSGWGAAEAIENNLDAAFEPAIAIDADGNATAAFAQFDGTRNVIHANRYIAGSGWNGDVLIGTTSTTALNGDAAKPQVSVDRSGNAMVVWEQFDGVQVNVWANYFLGEDNAWEQPRVIETENPGDATNARLAMNSRGAAVVVWQQADGATSSIQSNTYQASNPGVPNIAPIAFMEAALVADEQTSVTLDGSTAFDQDGTITSYSWTQLSGSNVILDTSTANTTGIASFAAPTLILAETLVFQLTVTDDENLISKANVTVTINPVNSLPTVVAGADQTVAEAALVNLTSTATDSDGTITSYGWTQLSGPAVVLANAGANASFSAPLVYQDTVLVFQVTVTDNEAGQALDTVSIAVFSTNPDDDADGMADLWEASNFGDLSRDGNGDFDNDGFTDLEEFQQGTNPLALTLSAPINLKAVADDSQVTLSWTDVEGAVGYNLYWSASPSVTAASGTLIPNVSSGYVHTELNNGTTYYYVVTTLSVEDESVDSVEVSATPGIRAWNASQRLDNSFFGLNSQIDANATGEAVAIWQQIEGFTLSTWVNHRDPETGWGTAQAIESGRGIVLDPQVAINDNGNAVAVWGQYCHFSP